MVKYLIVLAAIILTNCKNFSTTKARRADPLATMLKELSEKIIGSYPQEIAAYQQELRQAINQPYAENKEIYYRRALAKILASKAWREQGFFNLHRDRLLLDLQGTNTYNRDTLNNNLRSLKKDFSQLAVADNYWDILTYRERFFYFKRSSIDYFCIDENGYNTDIEVFAGNCVENYFKRISDEDDSYGKVVRRYCQEINQHYQEVFPQDFCKLDEDAVNDLIAKGKAQPHEFASLRKTIDMSSDAPFFTPVTFPQELRRGENFLVEKDSSGATHFFIKVPMPAYLQGVHASKYWLSRHTTNKANQNLHRAKIIWHSWFCSKISPDQASITKNTPTSEEVAYVQEYFDPNDEHTRKDRNCFACHRRIQPVANYFGKLSLDGEKFLAPDSEAFARPGGYWHDDATQTVGGHFSEFGRQAGLEGLADLLSNLPRVRKCLVNYTWENFFSSKYSLTATDTEKAVKVFENSGFNYRSLITHLLTKPEAIKYFTAGHQVFYDMVESKKLTCDVATTKGNTVDVIKSSCLSCHGVKDEASDEYVEVDYYAEGYFNSDGSITATGDKLQKLYDVIDTGYMPSDGEDYTLLSGYSIAESNDIQKKILMCHIETKMQQEGLSVPDAPIEQDLNAMGHEGDGT